MNAYLTRLNAQYDELRASAQSILDSAAADGDGGRDLTADELRSIEGMHASAEALLPNIRSLSAVETRNAEVAEMRSRLDATPPTPGVPAPGTPAGGEGLGGDQARSTSSTTTQDRDPGHYRSVENGGVHSFFGDQYRAAMMRDPEASARLDEHTRALTMTGEGVGTTAPKWLFDRFEMVLRQGRDLANAVTNLPLGRDPRPMTLPKQTVGTSTVLADLSPENTAPATTDQFDTDVDTITPVVTAGSQIFSRQFLDSATPAIDAMIFADLIENYNLQTEKRVGAAMLAAATVVTTFANEAAFTGTAPATPAIDAVIDAAIAVKAGRYAPADIIAMGTARWGAFRKLKDTSGRPLVPNAGHQVMNVFGVGSAVEVSGEIEGLGVIATEGISTGAYPNKIIVARASDTLLWEGDLMRFRYEEVSGPQSIKVGIWNYLAVSVRRPGVGQKAISVTAAV